MGGVGVSADAAIHVKSNLSLSVRCNMSIRSISSATLSFGLVSVPVKIYLSASAETVSLCMVTPAGNKVKQKYVDSITGAPVEYAECGRGYEVEKGTLVRFSKEELAVLDSENANSMEIKEFIPAESFNVFQVEKSYYLGPNKGGDKSYYLLNQVMKKQGKIAVAQWSNRGREHLVLVRPYEGGLVMHQMFYASEMRDFGEVPAAKAQVMEAEERVACMLVEALSSKDFEPQKYEDNYAKRVKEAVAKKQEGLTLTAPVKTQADTTDLLAALKASIEAAVNRN